MNEADYTGMGQVVEMAVKLQGDETKYRTPAFEYDEFGRVTASSIRTNETGSYKTRAFEFAHDDSAGSHTRVGPDGLDGRNGLETTVQLDAANRVGRIERGEPGASPVISETRAYGMCPVSSEEKGGRSCFA